MPDEDDGTAKDKEREPDELLVPCTGQMTLEAIIDSTGEFEHLNELVMLQLEKQGGFKGTEDYFATVTPILDLLEVEIRLRFRDGTTRKQMKLIIQDWIDKEISDIR